MAAVDQVTDRFGVADVLVHGPVWYVEKGIRDIGARGAREQLVIFLGGRFLVSEYVTGALISKGRSGSAVNVGSTAGHQGQPDNIGYTTAKGGSST